MVNKTLHGKPQIEPVCSGRVIKTVVPTPLLAPVVLLLNDTKHHWLEIVLNSSIGK